MAKTVADMAAKYLKGVQGGTTAYTSGINAVTTNPAQSAIDSKALWEQKMQEAIANNSWVQGLQGVTLQSWKQAAQAGSSKYAASATPAAAKWTKFANAAQPIWAASSAAVKSMPKGTKDAAMQRVSTNLDYMAQLKGKKYATS